MLQPSSTTCSDVTSTREKLLGVCKTLEASASVGQTQLDALWVCVGGHVGRTARRHCLNHTYAVLKPVVDAAFPKNLLRLKIKFSL